MPIYKPYKDFKQSEFYDVDLFDENWGTSAENFKISGENLLTHDTDLEAHPDIVGELSKKVDQVAGKGLSSNDYTTDDKTAVGTISQKAPTISPTFTGTPTAPTANKGTNNTQIATTAFAQTGLGDKADKGLQVSTATATIAAGWINQGSSLTKGQNNYVTLILYINNANLTASQGVAVASLPALYRPRTIEMPTGAVFNRGSGKFIDACCAFITTGGAITVDFKDPPPTDCNLRISCGFYAS